MITNQCSLLVENKKRGLILFFEIMIVYQTLDTDTINQIAHFFSTIDIITNAIQIII